MLNAETQRTLRNRRVVCHDGRGGRVRKTREREFDAETRRRGDRRGEKIGGQGVLDSMEVRGRGFDVGL